MLLLFGMKAIAGFVGFCVSIAAVGVPAFATADTSVATGQSQVASLGDGDYLTTPIPFMRLCTETSPSDISLCSAEILPDADTPPEASPATSGDRTSAGVRNQQPEQKSKHSKKPDFNRAIYYRNKLEFSLDVGWHPINIPFPLDVFVGGNYNTYPLKYTLVPVIASLRWHINGIGGPLILRGNWDFIASGSITAIPRGPETRYFSYDMGIRRNFVPRNWRIAPYWDIRLGVGNIDAKGPLGVRYAQGETLTFTVNMGSGVRYNFSPRYSLSGGLNFMHISNLDLSNHVPTAIDPHWGTTNYGINVYGPMVGFYMQLGKHLGNSGR